MQRTGAVPLSGISECGLPRELWEVIVQLVDDPSLLALALVSVFMHKQCFGNAIIWRRKCGAVYGTTAVKPGLLSWKQYYYAGKDLFPYRGITVGISTYDQLMSVAGAESKALASGSKYVVIDQMTFWMRNDVCDLVSLSRYIPRRWQFKGLTWNLSFNESKALFKRWTGNYNVHDRPRTKQLKKNKVQWSAGLRSVVKSDVAGYYDISLSFFSTNDGSEDRAGMLSSISIEVRDPAASEQTYNARQCVD